MSSRRPISLDGDKMTMTVVDRFPGKIVCAQIKQLSWVNTLFFEALVFNGKAYAPEYPYESYDSPTGRTQR